MMMMIILKAYGHLYSQISKSITEHNTMASHCLVSLLGRRGFFLLVLVLVVFFFFLNGALISMNTPFFAKEIEPFS